MRKFVPHPGDVYLSGGPRGTYNTSVLVTDRCLKCEARETAGHMLSLRTRLHTIQEEVAPLAQLTHYSQRLVKNYCHCLV